MAFMTNQWLKEAVRRSRHLQVFGCIKVSSGSGSWIKNNNLQHVIDSNSK